MGSTLSMEGRADEVRQVSRGRHAAPRRTGRLRAIGTMPVHIVGSLVTRRAGHEGSSWRARREAVQAAPLAPAEPPALVVVAPDDGSIECVVLDGEGASDLAARFGVSTAALLALNGLSWKTTLTAGQVLRVRPAKDAARQVPVSAELERHAVGPGETVSEVADRHRISTAALLLANGLSRGSAIHAGQLLVIPGGAARRPSSRTAEVLALTGEMRWNAHAVIAAGRSAGVPDDGLAAALAASIQDASLRNLDFGAGVGVGLFHRRAGTGSGSREQLLDAMHAALAFFGGEHRPSGVTSPGLLDTPGWELMSVGEAAAAVQGGSATAYAKWEDCARSWVRELSAER